MTKNNKIILVIVIILIAITLIVLKLKKDNAVVPQTETDIQIDQALKEDSMNSINASLDNININASEDEDFLKIEEELNTL